MTDTAPQALPVVDGVSVGDIQPLLVLSHRVSDSNSATTIEECTYYILGTAHVSSSSCDDVRRLVRAVRPDVVGRFAPTRSFLCIIHALEYQFHYGFYADCSRGAVF
jgi:hypothetical protein